MTHSDKSARGFATGKKLRVSVGVFTRAENLFGVSIPKEDRTPAMEVLLSRVLKERNELLQKAVIDFTGLHSKAAFEEEITRVLARQPGNFPGDRRQVDPTAVTIAFFDLNDFKSINDIPGLGHAAGDQAIKHVARILKENTRSSDFLAHWGGDEYAIIMYDHLDSQTLRTHLENVREAIGKTPFIYRDNRGGVHPIALSAAYGVREIAPGDTPDSIIEDLSRLMKSDKHEMKGTATARLLKTEAPATATHR